jgi:hypothetical protein
MIREVFVSTLRDVGADLDAWPQYMRDRASQHLANLDGRGAQAITVPKANARYVLFVGTWHDFVVSKRGDGR